MVAEWVHGGVRNSGARTMRGECITSAARYAWLAPSAVVARRAGIAVERTATWSLKYGIGRA